MPTRKPNSLIPSNDQKRLAKLYEYEIIDTSPEDEFDKIAKLAATIFDCPSAFITFVDSDTVFFKSNISKLPENKVQRKDSLCSLTILENDVTVIEDASQFNDLMESPFVCQPGGIRFYAGAPLITPEGYKLGSICVIDDKPRTPTAAQLSILSELSTFVMDKLETRAANKKIMEIQTEYINRSVHDLKNYLANLLLATDLLKHANLENKFRGLPETISRNAHNLSDRMDSMLNLSRIESSAYTLFIQSCNISEQLDKVIDNYSAVSNNKGQQIVKQYSSDIVINADCNAINEIFENLFSNALKYSFLNSSIVISATEDAVKVS
jgi:two-component sensor histidine kinase